MRTLMVAGNWKMHGTLADNRTLIESIKAAAQVSKADVVVAPPFVYIPQVIELAAGSNIAVSAQDLSVHAKGAFTGEIAPEMLKDLKVSYALIGHSERRTMHHETDAMVADKFAAAQRADIIPILCIGETLEEREQNQTKAVVERQIKAVITKCGIQAFAMAVVAYEPVWAIGTGKTATPEQAQEVHAFIRSIFAKEDARIASLLRILYGGSVKAASAKELFSQPDVDGGLVGGAALDPAEFSAIIQAV